MSVDCAPRMKALADKVRASVTNVLQYNRDRRGLVPWEWSHLRPTTVNARVEPHHLQTWRVSHRMLGPCCLCPMASDAEPDFKEAAIYQVRGASTGRQYVASCARDLCGYFVPLEPVYHCQKPGGRFRNYAHRAYGEKVPPRIIHISEKEACVAQASLPRQALPKKRTYAALDVAVRVVPAPTSSYRRVSNLLDLLDAHVRPGVTEAEFKTLFVKCEECRLILTRRAYRRHICNSTEEN